MVQDFSHQQYHGNLREPPPGNKITNSSPEKRNDGPVRHFANGGESNKNGPQEESPQKMPDLCRFRNHNNLPRSMYDDSFTDNGWLHHFLMGTSTIDTSFGPPQP